jgi:hypothetical protein
LRGRILAFDTGAESVEPLGKERMMEGTTTKREGAPRIRRAIRIGGVMAALGASALVLAVGVRPASAGIVQGCTFGSSVGYMCINVDTGGKDYANHRQWVTSIQVKTYSLCQNRWEAWTQGWYNQSSGGCYYSSPFWYINKWVGSGNYVCGRAWKYDPTLYGWQQATACIYISV